MGVSPAARIALISLMLLAMGGMVWRGVVIYQADQRAQRAAALVRERPALGAASPSPGAPVALESGKGGAQSQPMAQASPAVVAKKRLIVHVEGAVQRPGVYTLEEGSRVNDAIIAAGGAGPEAVPGALNLAAPLTDGAKVYVFTRAELKPAPEAAPAAPLPPTARETTYTPVTSTPTVAASASRPTMVNINTATAAELEAVPGIGPATARAIIEHRTKHGAFKQVDDLTAVSGIGPKTLEKLRPYLQV